MASLEERKKAQKKVAEAKQDYEDTVRKYAMLYQARPVPPEVAKEIKQKRQRYNDALTARNKLTGEG